MRSASVLVGLLALIQVATSMGATAGGGSSDSQGVIPAPTGQEDGSFPTLLIVEVLPHAPRDNEYVIIANPGAETVDGFGWSLSDGEGSWALPAILVPAGGTILATRNGTALWEDAGLRADVCVLGCSAALVTRGTLALRNEGDGLQLLDSTGRLHDAFLHGKGSPVSGWMGPPVEGLAKGEVARRKLDAGSWVDTNTSADWLWNRTFRLGQSRRPPANFEDVPLQPLLSPEDSLEGLLALLDAAQVRIDLAGFTLTNPELVDALRKALNRGVRVRIGLEASPPGGVGPEGERILEDLLREGAQILLMGSHGEGTWRRYVFHHAKYVVVDGTSVVLGSENFSSNGFPTGPGNRGWGVSVHDTALAGWFHDVWTEDWDENRSDVRSLPGIVTPLQAGDPPLNLSAELRPPLGKVTAFLAPDNAATEGLVRVLLRARDRIDVELFYLRWWWGDSLNPFVGGLLDAATRGVATRILLDGQAYNVQEDEDNDEAVRRLNQLAADHGLPLEARLFPGDPRGAVKVHNKGVLVDGDRVWVSSMNWNEAGAYANREAALLVDSREVASVFQQAFEEDWAQGMALGPPSSSLGSGGDLLLWIGLGSAAGAGAWWWVLRTTKESTNKHPRKGKTWRRRSKRHSSPSRRESSKSTRTAR